MNKVSSNTCIWLSFVTKNQTDNHRIFFYINTDGTFFSLELISKKIMTTGKKHVYFCINETIFCLLYYRNFLSISSNQLLL